MTSWISKDVTLATLSLALLLGPAVAGAGLLGNDITVSREFGTAPGGLVTLESATATMSAGLEFDDFYASGVFDIDVSDTRIDIVFNQVLNASPAFSFNGLVFEDSNDTIADFTAFTLLASPIGGLDASFLSFNANQLFLDLGGIGELPGDTIALAVQAGLPTVSMPVAQPLALLVLGVVGLAGLRRYRAPT
ncbi:MAG: hypothetical protein QNJ91_15450 [Gammaproteobacteria bacterium]|nr:hypothetical protein [Gammaproteobacteria bacterium]